MAVLARAMLLAAGNAHGALRHENRDMMLNYISYNLEQGDGAVTCGRPSHVTAGSQVQ